MNTVYWHCHECGQPIGKGELARVDCGNFYHITCWRESLRRKEWYDWYHEHVSPRTILADERLYNGG